MDLLPLPPKAVKLCVVEVKNWVYGVKSRLTRQTLRMEGKDNLIKLIME